MKNMKGGRGGRGGGKKEKEKRAPKSLQKVGVQSDFYKATHKS